MGQGVEGASLASVARPRPPARRWGALVLRLEGATLQVLLDLTLDAPHQAPQLITLRGEEADDELEALSLGLGLWLDL